MADQLASIHENVVSRIEFLITGIIQDQGDSFRFEAEVIQNPQAKEYLRGVPRHIQVSWRKPDGAPTTPTLRPGQVWRAAVIFRQPRSALNPHGFDFEAHLFSRNIRAIGRIRGHPVFIRENSFATFTVIISGARQYLRQAMRTHIGAFTFGAVLIALAIGDQDSVPAEHWEIFNKTGITHLVSISGSHVTMLAAFGGLSMLWIWKRLRWRKRFLSERLPAKVVASIAALSVAWLYCLLAGWGVPARRTFFMLLVSGLALILRLPFTASGILSLSAAAVTIIDPWSPVATGFWLSFGAVAVLFYVSAQDSPRVTKKAHWSLRCWKVFKESARLQVIITLAMLPALAFLFHQVSLSSPLANAIAIPVITFVVTPLALIMALVALIPGLGELATWLAWLAHTALEWTMVPVTWLAHMPHASFSVAAMPVWCLVLSLAGVTWALQPPGVPVRWAGWTLLLPALAWQPEGVPVGAWHLTALDVGQGSAVMIQTTHHALLFDTGPRLGTSDAGQRIVAPALRAFGVRKLDALVISHADIDHAGGAPGLLREIPVTLAWTSFDFEQFLKHSQQVLKLSHPINRPDTHRFCKAGVRWHWDGVDFTFLHPTESVLNDAGRSKEKGKKLALKTNANSCVLHIQGKYHSALLPGDIGVKQEKELIERSMLGDSKNGLRADVVLVAHHGSMTSSSDLLITQLGASHAIAQAGYLNRFSHPANEVEHRWKVSQTQFWRTDRDGAVTVQSRVNKLHVFAHAQQRKKYWHQRY